MALVNSFDSIIFDYGGVLVKGQTESDQANMARPLGIETEQFHQWYWADRLAYDKATLTAAEYWNNLAAKAGTQLTSDLLDELVALDTRSWMHFDEPMWDWIKALSHSGKQVAMLSNMPLELGEALKSTTPRLDLFDQVTLSYELRSVKPEPAIYQQCLDGLQTNPERTLFLDDRIENVQGAEMLGIRAMQFLDRDAMLLQLNS